MKIIKSSINQKKEEMQKNQKIGLGVTLSIAALIIAASLIYSYEKTYDIGKAPSAVNWADDIQNQIATVREAEDFDKAQVKLEENDFPLRVLKQIPKKASELNLPWADKVKEKEFTLFLFTAEKRLVLLDESKNKRSRVRLTGFEPGFVIKNGGYNYYLLESFSKVLNEEDLTMYPLNSYWDGQEKKQEKKVDKVIKSVKFTDKFYPCSLYDDIDFWVRLAKKRDIKLLGHFGLPSSKWKEVAYSEAQSHLDIGYVIALDLPDNSSYIKLESGKEYIQTANEKMAIKLP